MKKLLTLCLTLVLLANCAITVFAAEDTCAGSGETEIRCHVYSTYSITMPALIDMGAFTESNLGIAEFVEDKVTITNANIEPGYRVEVYVTNLDESGTIKMTNIHNPEYTGTCVLKNMEKDALIDADTPLVTFCDTELELSGTLEKHFQIAMQAYSLAGEYTGTMTYSFSCNPYEQ